MCGKAGGFVLKNDLARDVKRVLSELNAWVKGEEIGNVFIALEALSGCKSRFNTSP